MRFKVLIRERVNFDMWKENVMNDIGSSTCSSFLSAWRTSSEDAPRFIYTRNVTANAP